MREKRKLSARDIYSTTNIITKLLIVSMCGNKFWTTCSNFTMIQRLTCLGSSFYWNRFKCIREKERVLGKEEGKTDLRGRKSIETYRQFGNWPSMSLFITTILSTYYLLYFSLFLLFYKKYFYFISYQMNK